LEDKLIYFGESIIGRRSNNEDTFICEQIDDKTYLFIVADGMGGSEHGEVASRIAVDSFLSHIKETFQRPFSLKQMKSVLKDGFDKAQTAIRNEIKLDRSHTGMGTTMVVLLFHDGCYAWGNIGDSRLYVIDLKGIRQITRDHTYIEDVLKKKNGDDISQSNLDQYSHIITRSVSGGNDISDLYPEGKGYLKLSGPKMFILCSDGLITDKSNKKNEEEFYLNFQSDQNTEAFAKRLVKYAFENGSNDNITAICISSGQIPIVSDSRKRKKSGSSDPGFNGSGTNVWRRIVSLFKE
jgi:PPM family protein phosphatase